VLATYTAEALFIHCLMLADHEIFTIQWCRSNHECDTPL